jgi:hypothetical protein
MAAPMPWRTPHCFIFLPLHALPVWEWNRTSEHLEGSEMQHQARKREEQAGTLGCWEIKSLSLSPYLCDQFLSSQRQQRCGVPTSYLGLRRPDGRWCCKALGDTRPLLLARNRIDPSCSHRPARNHLHMLLSDKTLAALADHRVH